jgi:hypothetical protein
MLKHSRSLVEKRQAKGGRKRLYLPKISWRKWLRSGGENDASVLPESARKEARAGHGLREDQKTHRDDEADCSNEDLLSPHRDVEHGEDLSKQPTLPEKGKIPRRKGPRKAKASTVLWLRGLAADCIEFVADSDDLSYALKMAVAAYIVTWPAFVAPLNAWYGAMRGSWASLQLILVFENSIGCSFEGFFLRAVGVIFGCTVGFLAYLIGQGNRVVIVVVLAIGVIPSFYIQLGTPYVKTGIISIVSMCVVGLGKSHLLGN